MNSEDHAWSYPERTVAAWNERTRMADIPQNRSTDTKPTNPPVEIAALAWETRAKVVSEVLMDPDLQEALGKEYWREALSKILMGETVSNRILADKACRVASEVGRRHGPRVWGEIPKMIATDPFCPPTSSRKTD